MTPEFFHHCSLRGALTILPPPMDTPAARAMILAICLQESKFLFRKQVGGPAKGYAQFEQNGGVAGVFNHSLTAGYVKVVCAYLDITPTIPAIYNAMEFNDVLTAALSRLLLWTLPGQLAAKGNPELGWQQYVSAWRPGKPHRETWDANYIHAWDVVETADLMDESGAEALRIRQAAVDLITGLDKLRISIVGLV